MNTTTSMDPRAQRTRVALVDAVIALLDERKISDITIPMVVAHAKINRSSFYAHYKTLDTLLADAMETIVLRTGRLGGHSAGATRKTRRFGIPQAVITYIEHIDEYAESYRWVLGATGSPAIMRRLQERFRVSLDTGFRHHSGTLSAPDETLPAAYLSGAMIGAIGQWIMRDDRVAPAVFADWLWNTVFDNFETLANAGNATNVARADAQASA